MWVDREVNRANLFRYASLAMPLAFAGLPIYMLAPDFYSVHLSVSLSTLGIGLLALRLADAFIDPFIGRALDRLITHSKKIAILSCLALCFGFLMLFAPPSGLGAYLLPWFFVSVFLVTLAFSVLTILYGSVGAIWSREKTTQTLITSAREGLTLAGLILSISIPFVLMELLPASIAYLSLAILFVCLMVPAFFYYLPIQIAITGALSGFQNQRSSGQRSTPTTSINYLYVSYGLSSLASAIPAVLVVFYVRDYLGSQSFIGIALLIYFFSGALSMPLWHRVAAGVGKQRAWQISMVLAIASFTWVLSLDPGDYWLYALICLTSGFALGAEMALPPSILAEYTQQETNSGVAAKKYALLTMISKLSLALSVGLCLPILGYFGFVAGGENSTGALQSLSLLYGALPGVLKLFALIVMQSWIHLEKTRKSHEPINTFTITRSVSDA